jgi:hypothetical protein
VLNRLKVAVQGPDSGPPLIHTYIHLLVLQPCVGLGLLHGSVTVNFFWGGVVSHTPKPQPQYQVPHSVWPLPLSLLPLVALPGAYASTSMALCVIAACKPPLHNKAVNLEEEKNVSRKMLLLVGRELVNTL